LVGPIDRERTGNGVITCTDGFRSGQLAPDELRALCADLGVPVNMSEVDGSSLFGEITRPPGWRDAPAGSFRRSQLSTS
ncbi:MAG TPA: hypothetical protein PKL08_08995, partial [Thermoanaerobaculaceae bacterium]|nr:hypothetical protein [Thermoanaerobaculaceae bacterium]